MREVTYSGAVHGRAGNFGILFPDFLGCVSSGDTVEAALQCGRQALQFHIEGMEEDNLSIPEPRNHTLENVAATFSVPEDADPDDWVGLLPVTVTVSERTDHVAIAIPLALARDLDAITPDRGRFIIEATRRELLRLKQSA